MGLYLDSGYADQESLITSAPTFTFEIGGRGTGKTYGALLYLLQRPRVNKFVYLRRTQIEADLISNDYANPFKKVSSDHPGRWDISFKKNGKEYYLIFDGDDLIGYSAALSTFANIRGIDFSDVDIILYDEFIPQKGSRPVKEEFDKFRNLYESINRNRELEGKEPVKVFSMANSNDIANPIFMGLEIVNRIGKMVKTKTAIWTDPERGLRVIMLQDSPISKKKRLTALYRLGSGSSEYDEMALENVFSYDQSAIASRSLKEYRPLVSIGELVIHKHKSRQEYYVNCHASGTVKYEKYKITDKDIERFIAKYNYLYFRYLSNNLLFEDPASMVIFEKIFK